MARKIKIPNERLKRFGIVTGIALVTLCTIYFVLKQSTGNWQQSEVAGVMQGMQPAQGYGDTSFRMSIKLKSGKVVDVDVDHVSVYNNGKQVILNESANQDTGAKEYRYLRDL